MSSWLKKVAGMHQDWVNMATKISSSSEAEDLVQDMYLKLINKSCEEKAITNGKPNKPYIFVIMSNMYKDSKKKKQIKLQRIGDLQVQEVEIDQEKEAFYIRYMEIVDSWDFYYKKLYLLYATSGMSMRKIAEETKISVGNIFTTIKECKRRLQEELGDEYYKINE